MAWAQSYAIGVDYTPSATRAGNAVFNRRVIGPENRYVLSEVWRGTAALESHFARTYTQALLAMFEEALVRPVTEGGLRFSGDLSPAARSAPVASDPTADLACRYRPAMDTPLILIANLHARPGKATELGRSLAALVAPTRREEGRITYVLRRAADDPALFMLYDIWRARADLDRHFEEPNLRAFLAQQKELLAAPLEMRSYATLPE